MSRKSFFASLFLVLFVSISLAFAGAQKGEEAFTKIMDGNKRFVSGNIAQKDIGDSRRKELLKGQNPSAIVVTCSDSRVSPEIIFDQGLGNIFVIRVAGNVLDPVSLGSIEYAAGHLHTPLLILLGHEKCGAVSAALDAKEKIEGNIGAIIKKILPAVKKAAAKGGTKEDMLNNTIKENIALSKNYMLAKSPVLKHLIESGELKVVTGVYHLGSGEVELLSKTDTAPEAAHHKSAH
ncbi:MAG: carbonic anhydrase [Nitrospirae bacterium]|nr:carbonic anhydrase [Nitrospirota bacterium]